MKSWSTATEFSACGWRTSVEILAQDEKKDPEVSFSRFLNRRSCSKKMTSSAAFRCVQAWLLEKPAVWAEADVASLAAALMVQRPPARAREDALLQAERGSASLACVGSSGMSAGSWSAATSSASEI